MTAKSPLFFVPALAITAVLCWHVYLCQQGEARINHAYESEPATASCLAHINPLTDVVTIERPSARVFGITDHLEVLGFNTAMQSVAAPIAENTLSLYARTNFDLYAMAISYRVQLVDQKEATDDKKRATTKHASDDHTLHLLPSLSGQGTVSDGRTYSISLLSAYQGKIPPGTELFAQGIFSGVSYRGAFGVESPWDIVFIRDERDKRRAVACLVSPEQIEDPNFPYREGDRVQLFGIYYVAYGYDGFLNFRGCRLSSPTDRVVWLSKASTQP